MILDFREEFWRRKLGFVDFRNGDLEKVLRRLNELNVLDKGCQAFFFGWIEK